jgi:predicted HicB family RNase H-like nuclease
MSRANEYNYSIAFDERDQVFVGRVHEFKSLAAHGDSPEAAFAEIRFIVDDVIQDLEEAGEPIPTPRRAKPFSGKFVVRMPRSLHQTLAETAEDEGVSLNQLVVTRLASSVGDAHAE